MKFNDLKFTHSGCCGCATWAEVRHPNGIRTEIHDSDDDNSTGPFRVATWLGQTLFTASAMLEDRAAVEARLARDAALTVS